MRVILKHLKNKSGIYIITNTVNNKTYIGSSYDILLRFKNHMYQLRNKKHNNTILQNSFNCYGESVFLLDVLELCDREILVDREQFFINQFKPEMNIARDTKAPMRGRKHSQKTLDSLKGRIPWNLGVPRTEAEKSLMSSRRKEEWFNKSPEYKKQFSDAHKINPSKYWLGKKLPAHMINLLIERNELIKQKIQCNETGEIFDAQLYAAKKYGIKQGHISEHLNGKRLNVKGYTFKRIKNEL